MQLENISYALTQVIHNFGALAVVGGAIVALKAKSDQLQLKKNMAWLVLFGWSAQGASGLIFGGISLLFYGETPDLHTVAAAALSLKILCAALGFVLAVLYVRGSAHWTDKGRQRVWHSLVGLGGTALTGAAFLRWFA